MWKSLSRGRMSFEEVVRDIRAFCESFENGSYRLIIGTDGRPAKKGTVYYTAIVIWRVGKGARGYVRRKIDRICRQASARIIYETSLSLDVAAQLCDQLADIILPRDIEIHIDAGGSEKSRAIVMQAIGMVAGSGYRACAKPESYAAYIVADRFTKRSKIKIM